MTKDVVLAVDAMHLDTFQNVSSVIERRTLQLRHYNVGCCVLGGRDLNFWPRTARLVCVCTFNVGRDVFSAGWDSLIV